jgi:hypothetical protein
MLTMAVVVLVLGTVVSVVLQEGIRVSLVIVEIAELVHAEVHTVMWAVEPYLPPVLQGKLFWRRMTAESRHLYMMEVKQVVGRTFGIP